MKLLKRSFIIVTALLLQPLIFVPYTATAETTPVVDPVPTVEPVPPVTATEQPTSPDVAETPEPVVPAAPERSPYIFNEATGLWENDKYTWNPVTRQTAPKGTSNYSYNPATGSWDTKDYYYDAQTGRYQPNLAATSSQPNVPANTRTPGSAARPSLASPQTLLQDEDTQARNNKYALFYNAEISNNIVSGAYSGDASVMGNNQGGSAVSGNALAMATVINMLQSVWSPANGSIATFTTDIDGDVTGDLTIDPGQIPDNLAVDNSTYWSDLEVRAAEDTSINNTINLAAGSGQSKVASNTSGGDATTGTATAVANVVNMLNSMITAGQSFVGTVNINGNLNGDILLPEDMMNELLASNVPRATLTTDQISNSNLLADFTNNTSIQNNVFTDATSGNAEVSGNTAAGSATTGSATNNVTILNLTGRQIIGSNAMLVFVNVLGNWVGMIMDAPGATSAMLGDGISENTLSDLDGIITAESDATITNDITLTAHSGDAIVTHNNRGGDATSGDVQTAANIANVSNSAVSVGGWFGVLFINVLGNWLGSFGVNTEAGNAPVASTASETKQPDVQVFRFSESSNGTRQLVPVASRTIGTASSSKEPEATPAVLAREMTPPPFASMLEPILEKKDGITQLFKLFGISSLLFLGGESLLSARKRRSHAS